MTNPIGYKNTKWAKEIIAAQNVDGLWGNFHSLAIPQKNNITTEQALRRLKILGYDITDPPISKAVEYIADCLANRKVMPGRREKSHDWDAVIDLLLATWARIFTDDCDEANKIAQKWADTITGAFKSGEYGHQNYLSAYEKNFGKKPWGARLVDFVSFYPLSLVGGMLDIKTDEAVVDYVINKSDGIYYMYDTVVIEPPKIFASKNTVRYIAAMELLSNFLCRGKKLRFAADWLIKNKNDNGKWDLGPAARDNLYFPLSDNWRTVKTRESDCTYFIEKVLNKITE